MARLRFAFTVALAVSTSGCLASTTLIKLSADGSGTVEQTMTMSAEAAASLKQLAAGFGGKGAEGKPLDLFDEGQLREAAPKLGEGVRFVSSERIRSKDAEGVKAVYAFADIRTLHVNQKPDVGSAPAPGLGGESREDVAFQFTRRPGGASAVTVVFPELNLAAGEKPSKPKADKVELGMLQGILKGLRISIALEVAGRILKTNSPYVNGSTVTLLEMDFEQLLADPSAIERLQGAGSLEEAKSLLKGVKGLTINPDRQVTIEFAGR